MRDHVTDEHTQRVADLTVALARRMGIPKLELGQIRRGALIHDIGKMAIPDAILQKPDVLSATEMACMQTHPEKAFQILSQIDYLRAAIDIPYCHHEKWDGTGYPRGLEGRGNSPVCPNLLRGGCLRRPDLRPPLSKSLEPGKNTAVSAGTIWQTFLSGGSQGVFRNDDGAGTDLKAGSAETS